MTSTNGRRPPKPPTTRSLTCPLPIAVRAALHLLWVGVLDKDDAAVARALQMLPDDREVRSIALAICEVGLAAEPRLRCDAARENLLDQLALVDIVYRTLTGRV